MTPPLITSYRFVILVCLIIFYIKRWDWTGIHLRLAAFIPR